MIRPLRQRHYQTFVAIGFVLPVVFALGIVGRKPFPSMEALPNEFAAQAEEFPVLVWARNDLFAKAPIQVRLRRGNPNQGLLAVTFSADQNVFIKPDLMVYWTTGNPTINGRLSERAKLLGGFNSVALPLPAEAAGTNGVLVLYSLADNEIVDVSKPIGFNDSMK